MTFSQRYCSDRMYNSKRLRGRFATYKFYADIKSLHEVGFSICYPKLITKGGSLGATLNDFVHNFGFTEHLTFNGLQSQVGQNMNFNRNLCRYRIDQNVSAPRQPNENPAEGSIREIKRHFYRTM